MISSQSTLLLQCSLTCITMVSLLLGLTSSINEWYSASNLPVEVDLGVKVATPAGTVVGQLLFGFHQEKKEGHIETYEHPKCITNGCRRYE